MLRWAKNQYVMDGRMEKWTDGKMDGRTDVKTVYPSHKHSLWGGVGGYKDPVKWII